MDFDRPSNLKLRTVDSKDKAQAPCCTKYCVPDDIKLIPAVMDLQLSQPTDSSGFTLKVLEKLPKNSCLRVLMQIVDCMPRFKEEHKEVFYALIDARKLFWTQAAEHMLEQNHVGATWNVHDYMELIKSYCKFGYALSANRIFEKMVCQFDDDDLEDLNTDVFPLYVAVARASVQKKSNKHSSKLINPDQGSVNSNADAAPKYTTLTEMLKPHYTNTANLRGAAKLTDLMEPSFYKNFILPEARLSYTGLCLAMDNLPPNGMVSSQQLAQYIILYGHDGYDVFNNAVKRRRIWKAKTSPFVNTYKRKCNEYDAIEDFPAQKNCKIDPVKHNEIEKKGRSLAAKNLAFISSVLEK